MASLQFAPSKQAPARRGPHRPDGSPREPALRRLSVAAGFYPDAGMAELVRRCLADDHRLGPGQITLLAPHDADTARYVAKALRWRHPRHAGWLAHAWATLCHRLGRRRRFDARVQARLAAGQWALLVHDVPMERQVDVVRDLRRTGMAWCADAPHLRRQP